MYLSINYGKFFVEIDMIQWNNFISKPRFASEIEYRIYETDIQ
jgi:hypothetical protein